MSDTLVDFDPETKVATHMDVSDEGIMTVASMQDVEDIVEANKLFYNDVDERARWGEHFIRVGSIPTTIWFELVRTGRAEDPKEVLRWLDNSDHKDFRTRPGKLSR